MFPVSRGDRLLSGQELRNVKQSPETTLCTEGQVGQVQEDLMGRRFRKAREPSTPAWDVVMFQLHLMVGFSTET